MKKNFRTAKATFVFAILLSSLVLISLPTVSAGLIKLTPNVIISYDTDAASQVITPIETKLHIPLRIQYQVTGALVSLPNVPEYLDTTTDVFIDLSVESCPSFCSASITPSTIQAPITQELSDATPATLIVSVNENAPGFDDFVVRVKAKASEVSGIAISIPEKDSFGDIRVQPSFAALISIEQPKGNFMEIGPMGTADFEIKVENLGNAPTEVTFEVVDIPEDWSPNVQETVILGSGVLGEDSSKTVTLRIKPPYGFGYHNDRKTIQVKVTPSYYRNAALEGKIYTLNFTIQSRGFSTPGFEGAMLLIALAGVIGFILYKKRKK